MESDTHILYFTKLSAKSRYFYFLVWIHLNHILSRKQPKNQYPNIFSIDNKRVCGDQQIANGLNTYLSNIGKTPADNFETKDEYKLHLRDKQSTNFEFVLVDENKLSLK